MNEYSSEKMDSMGRSITPETPWPLPAKADCHFYHSMDFPDGDSVMGTWDIRGRFEDYIGKYTLRDKTVLDVGTSSGYLAFCAERSGAKSVTATDARRSSDMTLLPFKGNLYHDGDLAVWDAGTEAHWQPARRGFWYAWHKYRSNAEVVYASLQELRYWERRFDVVIAGAILEHLSDPVSAIGVFARLAKEAVIVAFTPVEESDELTLRSITDMVNPQIYWTWWMLSRGLYQRVFRNVGFEVEFLPCSAIEVARGVEVPRMTIVARRA